MPDVIRTPGRTWTNLDALEYESLVDPLDYARTRTASMRRASRSSLGAKRLRTTRTSSRSTSAVRRPARTTSPRCRRRCSRRDGRLRPRGRRRRGREDPADDELPVAVQLHARPRRGVLLGHDPGAPADGRDDRRASTTRHRRGRRRRELVRPVRLPAKPRRGDVHVLAQARRRRHLLHGQLDRGEPRLAAHPQRRRDRTQRRGVGDTIWARSSATRTSTSTSRRVSGTRPNTPSPTSSPAASSTTTPARCTKAFRTSAARPGTRRRTSVRTRSCSPTTPRPTRRRSSSSTTTTPRRPTPPPSGRSTPRTSSTWSLGPSPKNGANMLVEGFFVPVLEEIEVDEFRDDLEELIAARSVVRPPRRTSPSVFSPTRFTRQPL